jgi:hypothetical protein
VTETPPLVERDAAATVETLLKEKPEVDMILGRVMKEKDKKKADRANFLKEDVAALEEAMSIMIRALRGF